VIDYLAVFGNLSEPERPWAWRGQERDVRDGLYRSLEAEQAAAAAVRYPSEPARILALAQAAFGQRLVHHVGAGQAGLRPSVGLVLDHDRQAGAGQHDQEPQDPLGAEQGESEEFLRDMHDGFESLCRHGTAFKPI